MGLRIQTNAAALNTHRQLEMTDTNLSRSLERLSSGYRINRAKDDSAGLSMSNKFVAQIKSMSVASRNTTQANSLLQIAEGGMDQIQNILGRLKELATQAASANSLANLADIDTESDALISEIDRIRNSTTFQGTDLLTGYGVHSGGSFTVGALSAAAVGGGYGMNIDNAAPAQYSVTAVDSVSITIKNTTTNVSQIISAGVRTSETTFNFTELGISFKASASFGVYTAIAAELNGDTITVNSVAFQIGETNDADYQVYVSISDSGATAISVNAIDLSTLSGAQTAMTNIDNAITALNTARAKIGAVQNRLDYTSANLATAIENASAANSVIKDVDMAAEMTALTKNQILLQAGTAMLAQANIAPQGILSLIGG